MPVITSRQLYSQSYGSFTKRQRLPVHRFSVLVMWRLTCIYAHGKNNGGGGRCGRGAQDDHV